MPTPDLTPIRFPAVDEKLADVLRRMLEDETAVSIDWSPRDGCYIASVRTSVNITEDEAEALEGVQNGDL